MASTEAKIHDAAARNAELLAVLAETDHAVPDLLAQNRLIEDLQAQAREAAARVATLDSRRKKELAEHERYRDSVVRRFAWKVSGRQEKFAERAAKEEREYFASLQMEHQGKQMAAHLDEALAAAVGARGALQAAADRHTAAQQDLDRLYRGIFQGPSPGFPEEDAREDDCAQAGRVYGDARRRAEAEGLATRLLADARRRLQNALGAMDDALRASRRDMYGGGTFHDMMERNALHQAEMHVAGARMLVLQAQGQSPAVRDLPPVTIAQGSLMSDVFFDNIFTDMAFHEKIERSAAEVHHCALALEEQLSRSQARHAALGDEVGEKGRLLETSRVALQKAREAAFKRTLQGSRGGMASDAVPDAAPPAYSA